MPEVSCHPGRRTARPALVGRGLNPGGRGPGGARFGAIGAAVALAVVSVAGCGRMGAALGQQWIVVQFKPNTTVATARQVTKACSHLPNLGLAPVRPTSADPGTIDSARYNATNATDANLADLQRCLERFPSVQGINLVQPGDS